jgi:hypothetical protein
VASAKGLHLFEPRNPVDRDLDQRLFYVAMTRALDVLIVAYSMENKFIDRIVASGNAEEVKKICQGKGMLFIIKGTFLCLLIGNPISLGHS